MDVLYIDTYLQVDKFLEQFAHITPSQKRHRSQHFLQIIFLHRQHSFIHLIQCIVAHIVHEDLVAQVSHKYTSHLEHIVY